MSKKPLLWNTPEVDEAHLPRRLREKLGADYIPGYSEIVFANDLSLSDKLTDAEKEEYYKKEFGVGPNVLPYEFKWVRVSGPHGQPSDSAREDTFNYRRMGYKPVTVEAEADFKAQFGFGFPPVAHIGADGMIRHRDSALFYVDRETADRLERERIEANRRFLGANQPDGKSNIPRPYSLTDEETGSASIGATHTFDQ